MYQSQTETVIAYIRANPGIARSTLIDIKSNGERIANLTARISQAREKLRPFGETIKCYELPGRYITIKWKRRKLRRTCYTIASL